jgi:hypothetical protein
MIPGKSRTRRIDDRALLTAQKTLGYEIIKKIFDFEDLHLSPLSRLMALKTGFLRNLQVPRLKRTGNNFLLVRVIIFLN